MNKTKTTAAALAVCLASLSASHAQNSAAPASGAAELETLRAEVAAASSKMLVTGSDVQIRFPYAPLVAAVGTLNGMPASERTINVHSTAANGKFWEDGETWCHSFLELQGPNDLNGSVLLSNFGASPQANGSINLSVNAHIQARVQAHWHFMGKRFDIFVAGIKVGNACPPGGGFGGSIGGHGESGVDLVANLALVQSATSGSLGYALSLVSPNTANMTISVEFEHIGDLGIPMSFNLPMGKLSSGEFPMLLFREGSFELPDGSKRSYAVTLKPGGVQPDQTGITAKWTSAVTFK
jgi:hypothetical protein